MIKWLLPNHKISKETINFFDDLCKFFKKSQGISVKYEHLNNQSPAVEQIAKAADAISLVSNYEAIYLESFYEFTPLFKFNLTDISGLVVVDKNSRFTRLMDLKRQKIVFSQNTDWQLINPVILFFIRNCRIVDTRANKDFPVVLEPMELLYVTNKKANAAVTTSFDLNLLPNKERKSLKIIGEFPVLPEYVVIAGPEFKEQNIAKIKTDIDRWKSKHTDQLNNLGLEISSIEIEHSSLQLEAIEGLGYTLKKFIEEYNDLLLSSIAVNQQKDLEEMEEKYKRLKNFNEKLVKMYQEVRDSRDRLNRDIESSSDNAIMFLKDGTILGCSRQFCTKLKYSRQDMIGKEVTRFIETGTNTPFKALIQQIDVGLVRSFFVKLKISDDTKEEAKMEFSIIELLDSKIILGVISKNNK
ncbi:MAG: PAS domain-containing protein [Candidatus Marinimicrobia bacterium]|nr:PAS domain-containing protein [Candidatus Neomarinimicrobiota bacterium]